MSFMDFFNAGSTKAFFKSMKDDAAHLKAVSNHLQLDERIFRTISATMENRMFKVQDQLSKMCGSGYRVLPSDITDLSSAINSLEDYLDSLLKEDASVKRKVNVEAFNEHYFVELREILAKVRSIKAAAWPKNPKNPKTITNVHELNTQFGYAMNIFRDKLVPEGLNVLNKYASMRRALDGVVVGASK